MSFKPTIKNFVSAKSPIGLRRAMFRNNAKKMQTFKYSDIQFVNGKWFAWYEEVIEEKVINEIAGNNNGN